MKMIRVIKALDKKKLAKSYWIWFLNGVFDLEDWAGSNKVLLRYAENNDINSMAEYMIKDDEGINFTFELINNLSEEELQVVKEYEIN